MTQEVGLWTGISEIYARMSPRRRRQFHALLALMLLGALAELATISALIPFLSLLAQPSGLSQLPWPADALSSLTTRSGHDGLVGATLLFAALAIIAGIVRLQLAWSSHDFVFQLGHELAVDIQRRLLWQPYGFHVHRNTGTLVSSLEKTELLVYDVLMPLMHALIAAFISLFIIAALVYVDPFTAISAGIAFSLIYLLVSAATRRRLAANSVTMSKAYDQRLKTVHESLGGIRDVIVDNSQQLYLDAFRRIDRELSVARASTQFIGAAPRFAIEAVGMAVIVGIALFISDREGGLASALPILGAVALGAHRLLPLLQQIYLGWSSSTARRAVLTQVIELLRLPLANEVEPRVAAAPLPLHDQITIDGVSFTYPTRSRPALEEVTLEIPRGSIVGLAGGTGSGKSTLADLLMGLLEPTGGRILIDGEPLTAKNRGRWRRSIAHVPQSIFLADASIARNIALSLDDLAVDLAGAVDAARIAQLHDFVMTLAEGYATEVGERGIRLSGGQRQRLGIARAIYKQAPVLVLDEATSALDDLTEAAVIDALVQLGEQGRTIITIAHRRSTISRCDIVAHLHNGRLVKLDSKAELAAARL